VQKSYVVQPWGVMKYFNPATRVYVVSDEEQIISTIHEAYINSKDWVFEHNN